MSNFDIEWVEGLPQRPKYSGRYGWFYDRLEENPGKWAKYPGVASSALQFCKRDPQFEAREYDNVMYMRFVGEA